MSTSVDATATAAWTRLGALHDAMRPDLRAWFADDPGRAEAFSLTAGDLFVDLSKNLIDADVVALMRSLPRRQADDPTALGPVDAPVVMIVWSDYRCPFCARWATTTFEELKPYVASGSLRVEARDLVLFGEESTLAAVAARAAGEQGKFWEFHDAIFAAAPADGGHPTITTDDVVAFAKQAGVPDLARFRKDLTSKTLAAAVAADTDEARKLGISGTPFFLIDTTAINGAQPTDAFVQAIEAAGGRR